MGSKAHLESFIDWYISKIANRVMGKVGLYLGENMHGQKMLIIDLTRRGDLQYRAVSKETEEMDNANTTLFQLAIHFEGRLYDVLEL